MLSIYLTGSQWHGICCIHMGSSLQKCIRKLKIIQRKAARWARSCFIQTASVTKILWGLKWDDLADRQKNIRLTLLYKIRNKNMDIEFSEIGLIPSTRLSRRHQEQFFRSRANTDKLKSSFVFSTITE